VTLCRRGFVFVLIRLPKCLVTVPFILLYCEIFLFSVLFSYQHLWLPFTCMGNVLWNSKIHHSLRSPAPVRYQETDNLLYASEISRSVLTDWAYHEPGPFETVHTAYVRI
jgi:hypothetical protein